MIDFDNFEATGSILTMSVGADAVLVKERLEIGAAVYTAVLAAPHDFGANALLVKMMLRS